MKKQGSLGLKASAVLVAGTVVVAVASPAAFAEVSKSGTKGVRHQLPAPTCTRTLLAPPRSRSKGPSRPTTSAPPWCTSRRGRPTRGRPPGRWRQTVP